MSDATRILKTDDRIAVRIVAATLTDGSVVYDLHLRQDGRTIAVPTDAQSLAGAVAKAERVAWALNAAWYTTRNAEALARVE